MKNIIYSKNDVLFGHKDIIGFGDDTFKVLEIDKNTANNIIIKNHYSHKIYNATFIHLGVYKDNKLYGVLQYGYAMNPASQNSVVNNTEINQYLELNRMWLDDILGKNSESKAISYSIKYIKSKFKNIHWIQSFTDERCAKFGIVYQAANFSYYGEHKNVFWELDGVVYHNIQITVKGKRLKSEAKHLQDNKEKAKKMELRQFRYIYFINNKYKKDVLLQEKQYPKHYLIDKQ